MADDSGATRLDPEALFAGALAEAQSLVAERVGEAIRAAEARGYERGQRDGADADALERVHKALTEVQSAYEDVEQRFEGVETVPNEDATFDDVRQWLAHQGGNDMVNAAKLRTEVSELRDAIEHLSDVMRALSRPSHVREVG